MTTVTRPIAQQLAYGIAARGIVLYHYDLKSLHQEIGHELYKQFIDPEYQRLCHNFFEYTNQQLLKANCGSITAPESSAITLVKNDNQYQHFALLSQLLAVTANTFPCKQYIDFCTFSNSSLVINPQDVNAHTSQLLTKYHDTLTRIDQRTEEIVQLIDKCTFGLSFIQLKQQFPILHKIILPLYSNNTQMPYVANLTESQYGVIVLTLRNHLAAQQAA